MDPVPYYPVDPRTYGIGKSSEHSESESAIGSRYAEIRRDTWRARNRLDQSGCDGGSWTRIRQAESYHWTRGRCAIHRRSRLEKGSPPPPTLRKGAESVLISSWQKPRDRIKWNVTSGRHQTALGVGGMRSRRAQIARVGCLCQQSAELTPCVLVWIRAVQQGYMRMRVRM
eukprot:3702404-Pyramimonas_sp.AAC.1